MTPGVRGAVRRLGLWAALAVLLVLSWGALTGALDQIPRSGTAGRKLQTGLQLTAGALGVLVVATRFRLRRWASVSRYAWGASLAAAAGLSGLTWGPPMPWSALLFTALAAALAGAIVLVLRATDDSRERDRPSER